MGIGSQGHPRIATGVQAGTLPKGLRPPEPPRPEPRPAQAHVKATATTKSRFLLQRGKAPQAVPKALRRAAQGNPPAVVAEKEGIE